MTSGDTPDTAGTWAEIEIGVAENCAEIGVAESCAERRVGGTCADIGGESCDCGSVCACVGEVPLCNAGGCNGADKGRRRRRPSGRRA